MNSLSRLSHFGATAKTESITTITLSAASARYFLGNDGSFTSLKSLQTVFEDVPIQDFQIVQEASDDIVVKIVPKPEYTSVHTEFILKNIKMKGPARVRVELVDSIPLGSSGKIQRIVKSQSEPDYFAR